MFSTQEVQTLISPLPADPKPDGILIEVSV